MLQWLDSCNGWTVGKVGWSESRKVGKAEGVESLKVGMGGKSESRNG
jgi:hypothetical protein